MSILKKICNVFTLIFLPFSLFCLSVLLYAKHIWQDFSYEQVLITLQNLSLTTITLNASVIDYLGAFAFFIVAYPCCYFFLNTKKQFIVALITSLVSLWLSGFLIYYYYLHSTSVLYEKEYINPKDISYSFPEKKRNLILIYLESFEQNFSLAKHYQQNFIPNLFNLQKEGQYSLNHHQITSTNYSIASIVASECGIPLRFRPNSDLYDLKYFLPQAICFPEILRENGYQSSIIKASKITFSNVDIFAQSHGYSEALGADEILPRFHNTENIKGTFGGINDEALFSFAKEKLAEFSLDKPFMLTLFSLDTHVPTTYHNPQCSRTFKDTRDIFMCTDKIVSNFINWLKQSPYWENTTVVILGDHLLPFGIKAKDKPKRGIYNVFLNLPQDIHINPNKLFSTFDIAPSILESLGIKISPRAFGLGRSLFAEEPTLLGKMGLDSFQVQLMQHSDFYDTFHQPLQKREIAYKDYQLGTIITNAEIPLYTDTAHEVLNVNYIDRINLKFSENIKDTIHVSMKFNAFISRISKITITANEQDVLTLQPDLTQKPPYTVNFDIPSSIISNNQLSLKIHNSSERNTPAAMGIAPIEIKLSTK